MQSYSGLVVQPPQYDPASGQAAFDALAPNRAALPKVTVARVDVQATALVALGVYGFATQATQLHAQLQALDGAGLFSLSTLEGLKTAGLAAVYAFNQAESEGAFKTDAIVPAQLVTDATTVEQRMKKRCEYLLSNDPEVSPLLDMLRPGTGYAPYEPEPIGEAPQETDVVDPLLYSRSAWRDQGDEFCRQLKDRLMATFDEQHPKLGVRVRYNP